MTKINHYRTARLIKNGFQNIWRNLGLSLATTLVTALTLFAVSFILLLNLLIGVALDSLESKVDISVYFDPLASQEQISTARAQVTNMPEVASVRLVDRDQALAEFKESHKDNPIIKESLDELADNPLQTTLVVTARQPDLYQAINDRLSSQVDGQIIDSVNFDDNRKSIGRLSRISFWAKTAGLATGALLAIIAILVVYNTIRLSIYSRKEAIGVMKLVGAKNGFVRGPFIIEGIFYGVVASVITLSILLPILFWVSPRIESFFGVSSFVIDYIQHNLAITIIAEILVGAILGVFSSLLAMHRYLKV